MSYSIYRVTRTLWAKDFSLRDNNKQTFSKMIQLYKRPGYKYQRGVSREYSTSLNLGKLSLKTGESQCNYHSLAPSHSILMKKQRFVMSGTALYLKYL